MTTIFISYRQDDAHGWAVLLRERLTKAFDPESVFLDDHTLRAGLWREQIDQAIAVCKVFVLVIGRRWLTSADKQGHVRLFHAEEDVHRSEIEAALGRSGVTVLPVLVDGASMPVEADLPQSIRLLPHWQAIELRDGGPSVNDDIARLIDEIDHAIGKTRTSKPIDTVSAVARLGRWLGAVLTVLAATGFASVGILVVAGTAFGTSLSEQEISTLVLGLFVAFGLIVLRRLHARKAGRNG